jgi:SAM-dependent methyltransferase
MAHPLRAVLRSDAVRRATLGVSNWVDLQWALLISQLREVAPTASGRLLDVGCGSKPYESIFRPYVTHYIGLEYASSFLATHASQQETRRPDVYYDGKAFPFDDESFDTVLNVQVLEHTPDPQSLLMEMARVCRRGGVVIVNAPFSFRLHEEPNDFFRYTPHGLKAMFSKAGLVIDRLLRQGDLWSVLGHKLNSHLAFRVAHLEAMAQHLGKLGHEGDRVAAPRYWALPMVVPTMLFVSGASRLLDRLAPDGTETLSYLAVGHRE